MFKLHIDVNGRNLSIGMTFIESRILTAFGWMIVRTRSYEGKKFTPDPLYHSARNASMGFKRDA